MGTKSNRSSGTQFNPKGMTQGNTLVDPFTGLPIHVITDNAGIRRLAVDANITAQNITVDVNLDSDNDQVAVEDPDTGAHIKVELDGSINTNVNINAASGDNIAIKDTDGDELDINPDGSLNVKLLRANTEAITVLNLPTAATEVAFTFPNKTKFYRIRVRNDADEVRLGLNTGDIASGTYWTINRGTYITSEKEIDFVDNYTIYFESKNKNNVDLEIQYWYVN